jgi:hypothetical protein
VTMDEHSDVAVGTLVRPEREFATGVMLEVDRSIRELQERCADAQARLDAPLAEQCPKWEGDPQSEMERTRTLGE